MRDIYRMYFDEGMSMQNIANVLNAANVATKLQKHWTKRQIQRLLHCPLYEGTRHWDGVLTPNAHEPIIPPGPRRMRKKRRRRSRRPRAG